MSLCGKYEEMDALMRRGIQTEAVTGKPYFTGYSYESLYDWDQYFEGLVQLYMGWGTKYLLSAVDIFLDHQNADGFIPRAIDPPTLHRPDEPTEMVKPFLSQILLLCLHEDGQIDFLESGDRFSRLTAYLKHWLFALDRRGAGLSYWRSSPHTGMDNQRERAGDWGSDFCEGVDLNAYLCREISAYRILCGTIGRNREADEAGAWYEQRRSALLAACWDEEDGFFYDVDARTGERIRVKSVAGFAPMWAGIVSAEQAERLVREHLLNPEEFARPYPIPAYAAGWNGYSAMYLPGDIGCAWRCNTWIPTNYYVFEGLRQYGYTDEAADLAARTYDMIKKAGFREYYASETGEGCGLDPFWGWSLLGMFMPTEIASGYDPTRLERVIGNRPAE